MILESIKTLCEVRNCLKSSLKLFFPTTRFFLGFSAVPEIQYRAADERGSENPRKRPCFAETKYQSFGHITWRARVTRAGIVVPCDAVRLSEAMPSYSESFGIAVIEAGAWFGWTTGDPGGRAGFFRGWAFR